MPPARLALLVVVVFIYSIRYLSCQSLPPPPDPNPLIPPRTSTRHVQCPSQQHALLFRFVIVVFRGPPGQHDHTWRRFLPQVRSFLRPSLPSLPPFFASPSAPHIVNLSAHFSCTSFRLICTHFHSPFPPLILPCPSP